MAIRRAAAGSACRRGRCTRPLPAGPSLLLLTFLLAAVAGAAPGPPQFTGFVPGDFDESTDGVLLVPDPGGADVPIPSPPFTGPSGYDIDDVRLYYDRAGDTLYVGFNTFVIAGDADNDGDPDGTSPALAEQGGQDRPGYSGGETFGLVLDTDGDGSPDVVAGVDCFGDLASFGTYEFFGLIEIPFCSFGNELPVHRGTATDPATMGPHLEFTIENVSALPGLPHDPRSNPLDLAILAFHGSLDDWVIGEDHVPSQGSFQGVTFPYPAIVSGKVFEDLNENGIRDPDEPGIEGVGVQVDCRFSGGGSDLQTFSSLTSGLFGFYVDVPAVETADCTLSLDPATAPGWIPTTPTSLVLSGIAPGDVAPGNHFGLRRGPAVIRGTVFEDADGDGIADAGEGPVGAMPVHLDVAVEGGGASAQDTSTGADGTYEFDVALAVGETAACTVSLNPEDLPPGTTPTTPLALTLTGVTAGDIREGNDFGLRSDPALVSGSIFIDPNGDGIQRSVTDGIGGIRIHVEAGFSGGGQTAMDAPSDGNGRYNLSVPVPMGETATVTVSAETADLPGTEFTTAAVVVIEGLGPSQGAPGIDFGFQPQKVPLFGDWDGDGVDTVGLYEVSTSTFYLRNDNSAGPADVAVQLGSPGDVPIVGDWNGDGIDTVGTYTPWEKTFRLRNVNASGPPDLQFRYGPAGLVPLVGDWNGDGIDTIGLHDPNTRAFFLRDENAGGTADYFFKYGAQHVAAVTGDWDGDGRDSVGIYNPPEKTFFLKNALEVGNADYVFRFAGVNLDPVSGDFDGDGVDTVGVYNLRDDQFYLKNVNVKAPPDAQFAFSTVQWIAIRGDWDGDGRETAGAYDPARGLFVLRNANDPGGVDLAFVFGDPGEVPLVGDWDGDGRDTIGTYDPATRTFRLRNTPSEGPPDLEFRYGGIDRVPLAGDWDGDGDDTVGIFSLDSRTFYLKLTNEGGNADLTFSFGDPGETPLVGDWDGDSVDTVGTWDGETGTYRLRNANAAGPPDAVCSYGAPGHRPLVGDWNGDGITTLGSYLPSVAKYFLRQECVSSASDAIFSFPVPFW